MNLNPQSGRQMILKCLSGPQVGVEVALGDGEYTLGSGPDDDLQFVDVCLKSGHARIRVEGDRTLIAGGGGPVYHRNGLVIDAGDDNWSPLDALEVVTIGASTFALASIDADWTLLSNLAISDENGTRRRRFGRNWNISSAWRVYGAIGSAVAIVVIAISFGVSSRTPTLTESGPRPDIKAVRNALDHYEFGKNIEARQEVDGEIFITGFVDTQAEWRALHDAAGATGSALNFRVWVLSSIRSQVAAAIESYSVEVSYDISRDGVATFDGEILSDDRADRFFDYIRTEVPGITSVKINVKTAKSYFKDIQELARHAGIDDTVLLHLSAERVEANGVIVNDKIDGWIGFIQSYARRFADHIPLTSYVQLVNGRGEVIAQSSATHLAGANLPSEAGATNLDLDKIKQGSLSASDIFPNSEAGHGGKPEEPVKDDHLVQKQQPPSKADAPRPSAPDDLAMRANDQVGARVLERWDGAEKGKFLPLLLKPTGNADRCWDGSEIKISDIPNVLFWLDYLSHSTEVSILNFDHRTEYILLEAALNPDRMRACVKKYSQVASTNLNNVSLYLEQAERNLFVVRFITRDLVAASLDVSGVMLHGDDRFIQLRDGTKIHEGTQQSETLQLKSVGSLGSLLLEGDVVRPILYPPFITWKVADSGH